MRLSIPGERGCGVWDGRQTGTGLVETCRALCVCVPRVCRVCARRDASMYGDGVKYPQTVSKYWIQAGASLRILNTGLVKYPKSIRVSMRLPADNRDADRQVRPEPGQGARAWAEQGVERQCAAAERPWPRHRLPGFLAGSGERVEHGERRPV